jgi:putative ABC transport system permease protein
MHKEDRNMRMMDVFGRLKPGATLSQARADLSLVASHLEQSYPESYPKKFGYTATVASLRDELSAEATSNVLPLLAASTFVLLIACASVANLLLARVMRLERELAIRAALGATRGRLARQLLSESMLLSLTGGVLGLAMAPFALDLLTKMAARYTPRFGEIRIDLPVLLFTLGVSVATGILFGLAPALGFRGDVNDALKEGGKSTDTRGQQTVRKTLVVAQLAFSFVLLAGAGLALRSLWKMLTVDPGFHADKVLALRLNPSFTTYNNSEKIEPLLRNVLARAHAIPGVRSAALTTSYPLEPQLISATTTTSSDIMIEDHPVAQGDLNPRVQVVVTSPEYAETIGMPLTRGRWIDEHDEKERLHVAVINESMAKHRWPGQDPLGRRVSLNKGKDWMTVVGIVGDVKDFGLNRAAVDEIYAPLKQAQFANRLLLRTSADPQGMIRAATQAIHDAGQDVAVDSVRTLDQVRQESVASPRLTAVLLSLFAMLALLITAVGLGGVLALSVSQRRQELGIRMALGASHTTIIGMVLRQGLTMVALGIAIGLPASLALTRLITSLLYDVKPNDALTMTAVSAMLVAVAALACFIPARQATRIDPLIALRSE